MLQVVLESCSKELQHAAFYVKQLLPLGLEALLALYFHYSFIVVPRTL